MCCSLFTYIKPELIHLPQHDPEDEPVAPPLDPEFFEFDRKSLSQLRRSILTSRIFSAQGRHQPRAAEGTPI